VSQLRSTAALATAAYMRFSQGCASPLSATWHDEHSAYPPPARSNPVWPTTASIFFAVSHTFRKSHSGVLPAASQPSQPLPSNSPYKGNHFPEVIPPLPEKAFPENLLKGPLRLLPSAPEVATHLCTTPVALGAGIRQQAACILEGCSGSSLTTIHKTRDTIRQGEEKFQRDAHVAEEESLERSVAVLAHSHLCREGEGSQQGTLHRTILACEGIAINSLFDYGRPTCRVRHSPAAHSHLATVSSTGVAICHMSSEGM
jgi:hypothetical protein